MLPVWGSSEGHQIAVSRQHVNDSSGGIFALTLLGYGHFRRLYSDVARGIGIWCPPGLLKTGGIDSPQRGD